MTTHATGPFDVKLAPRGAPDEVEGTSLSSLSIDKRYHGALEATSKGEMLTAGAKSGSAVYVAIERVQGTLQGRRGTFVLVHQGAMSRDGMTLSVTVAKDTGTGELAGLSGRMAIVIEAGKHTYDLEYEVSATEG